MATMPNQYYSRFDPAKEYDEHLFIAGRGLQSAELNEIQKQSANRLRGVADALFKDGDIVRDAVVTVDSVTGDVVCASGAIYIAGAVRGLAPKNFIIPVIGTFAIGVRLSETVVTSLEDPGLKDPADGTRNYQEPGADRLRVHSEWGWSGDGLGGEFYPVYSVTNGFLDAKEQPPNLDSVTQAIARYDRDSAGGTYVISGLNVKQLDDVAGEQVYSVSEGRARVYGQAVEIRVSRRLNREAVPDLKRIVSEPQLSTTLGAQRFDFDRKPGANIESVQITAEKTVTLTHGVTTGAIDPLPDTSVLAILEVKQGAVTYTQNDDYVLSSSRVDWSPGGAEPSPGSTYTVKYQYITSVTPTAVDDDGFTVAGAVVGTLILATYSQKLPRIDRICIDQRGTFVWLTGVSAEFYPQAPTVPEDLLPLARVNQTWTTARTVVNDGVRVVPMPVLAGIDSRFDRVMQLIAQQRLESSIHIREGGTKKGIFTDPFLDDSQRDAGTPQTAAVVRGELMLPIAAAINQLPSDVLSQSTLPYTSVVVLEQALRTGQMKINPYMAFAPVPPTIVLNPAIDRWTEVQSSWLSESTSRFVVGAGDQSVSTVTTRQALISSTTSAVETLRQITVAFQVSGFGPGEVLDKLVFDGVVVATVPPAPVADAAGNLSGSFVIPAGIPTGDKEVIALGLSGFAATSIFSGQGTLERQVWQQQTTITETRWQSPPPPQPVRINSDPLAQTFSLLANTHCSSVDVWFEEASTTRTRVQIRTTIAGVPSQVVLAEKSFDPVLIVTGGNHTRIAFDAPVLLLAGVEYAIVVLCDDPNGSLAVAELGKFDENAQRWITNQPYTIGVLLSSSNASTWTPHQDRDMAFRILSANYTANTRTIELGSVAVTGATDLLLMGYADRPSSATSVEYTLALPDGSALTVSDGQPVQLSAPITGSVGVSARLFGDARFSPVLHPGTQLVTGVVAASADYVSRAVPAGASSTIKVIYEGAVPSGATIDVFYKGPDAGDTWTALPAPVTKPADDGFSEFVHTVTGVDDLSVQIKLVLNGTTAARPRARDLRVIVM